jgi:large subunit ribosomal protein L15
MLHTLPKITTRKNKRLGRGFGSGVGGHTVGRGTKGHNARQGKTTPLWFEGGQLPLIKRLPYWRGKFSFKSLQDAVVLVKVSSLTRLTGQDVTPETLAAAGLIRDTRSQVKIVGDGKAAPNVAEVRGVKLTQSAKTSLEKAGAHIAE